MSESARRSGRDAKQRRRGAPKAADEGSSGLPKTTDAPSDSGIAKPSHGSDASDHSGSRRGSGSRAQGDALQGSRWDEPADSATDADEGDQSPLRPRRARGSDPDDKPGNRSRRSGSAQARSDGNSDDESNSGDDTEDAGRRTGAGSSGAAASSSVAGRDGNTEGAAGLLTADTASAALHPSAASTGATSPGLASSLAPVLSHTVPNSLPPSCECCHSTYGCLGETASLFARPCGGGLYPLAPPPFGWSDPLRLAQRSRGGCLCVHVHGADRLIPDPFVLHPLVRVSIIDEVTGRVALRQYYAPNLRGDVAAWPEEDKGGEASNTPAAPKPVAAGPRDQDGDTYTDDTDEDGKAPVATSQRRATAEDHDASRKSRLDSDRDPWIKTTTHEASRVTLLPGGGEMARANARVGPLVAALDAVPSQTTDPTSVLADESTGQGVGTGLGLSGYSMDRLATWDQNLLFAGSLKPAMQGMRGEPRQRGGIPDSMDRVDSPRQPQERAAARTMLRPDSGLEGLVRPGVLVVFEVLDHGPDLPEPAVAAGGGFYPVAWGFVRLVAEDSTPRIDVDGRPLVVPRSFGDAPVAYGAEDDGHGGSGDGKRQRGPPGWVDSKLAASRVHSTEPTRSTGDDGAAGPRVTRTHKAKTRLQLDHLGRYMQVRMYKWQIPTAAERAAHTATIERAATHPGAHPGLKLVPTCPASLQYRMRRRVEAPFTLSVSMTAARVAPKQTQAEPAIARMLHGIGDFTPQSTPPSGPDRSRPASPQRETDALLAAAATRLSRRVLTLKDFGDDGAPKPAEPVKPRRQVAEDAARALRRRRRPTDPCRIPTSYMRPLPSARTGCLVLRFSEDGACLAAACADLAERHFPIRVFDADTGELTAEANGHTDLVYDVRWQPSRRRPGEYGRSSGISGADSDTMISAGRGGAAASATGSSSFLGATGSASGEGRGRAARRGLLSASADGTCRVWQVMTRLRTARCVATLSISPPTFVYSAAFHPNRPDIVVSGSFDGMLRLWQIGSDEVTASPGPVTPRRPPLAPGTPGSTGPDPPLPALPPWAYGGGVFPERCRGLFRGFLGCPPGIQGLSTARRAGESAITRSAHGGAALFSPTRPGTKGAASSEGFGTASASASASAAGSGESRGSSTPHSSHINCVQFHPSGGRLFSADGAGKIVIWDCGSSAAGPLAYKAVVEISHPTTRGLSIVDMQIRPGQEQLLVLTHRSGLRLFQLLPRALQLLRSFPGLNCAGSRLQATWSPDGRYVLAGSESGRCGIWDAESGREVLATPARVKRLGAVGFDSIMGATAWHPKQHVIALGAFGDGSPIVLYCREVSQ